MKQEILDTIDRNKAEIIDSMFSSRIDIAEFNKRLLTRQAIFMEFLIRQKQATEFQKFIRHYGLSEYYSKNKVTNVVQKKRISKNTLETFGMEDLIPRFTELGYEISNEEREFLL